MSIYFDVACHRHIFSRSSLCSFVGGHGGICDCLQVPCNMLAELGVTDCLVRRIAGIIIPAGVPMPIAERARSGGHAFYVLKAALHEIRYRYLSDFLGMRCPKMCLESIAVIGGVALAKKADPHAAVLPIMLQPFLPASEHIEATGLENTYVWHKVCQLVAPEKALAYGSCHGGEEAAQSLATGISVHCILTSTPFHRKGRTVRHNVDMAVPFGGP